MTIDGVVFFEDVVRSMNKNEFIEKCKTLFYLNIPDRERTEKLTGIYDKICGISKSKNRDPDSVL